MSYCPKKIFFYQKNLANNRVLVYNIREYILSALIINI